VDFDFIRKLAAAESQREVARMVNNVRFDPRFSRGFLRSVLRVRISGGRLVRIADRLFADSKRRGLS
jgi:hypothetical protein